MQKVKQIEIVENQLLTKREDEIAYWNAFGKSNEEIGAILGISPETVKVHLKHICAKLDVFNRTAVVTESFRQGILKFGAVVLALFAQTSVEISGEDAIRTRPGRRTKIIRTVKPVRGSRSRQRDSWLSLFEDSSL